MKKFFVEVSAACDTPGAGGRFVADNSRSETCKILLCMGTLIDQQNFNSRSADTNQVQCWSVITAVSVYRGSRALLSLLAKSFLYYDFLRCPWPEECRLAYIALVYPCTFPIYSLMFSLLCDPAVPATRSLRNRIRLVLCIALQAALTVRPSIDSVFA